MKTEMKLCEQLMMMAQDLEISQRNMETARDLCYEPKVINEAMKKHEVILGNYRKLTVDIAEHYKLKLEDYEIK